MERPDEPREHAKKPPPAGHTLPVWTDVPPPDEIPATTLEEELTEAGIDLPPAESLADESLKVVLWQIVEGLAERDVYLMSTNHLSDRELYLALTTDRLLEARRNLRSVLPPGPDPHWQQFIDFADLFDEAGLQVFLRYYICEEERERWLVDHPEVPMPPREEPPHDRDRHLPRWRFRSRDR